MSTFIENIAKEGRAKVCILLLLVLAVTAMIMSGTKAEKVIEGILSRVIKKVVEAK